MNNKLYKNKKGITLIALVITIIVLLLLAGISISFLSGQDGILTKTSEAKRETKEAEIYEGLVLAVETAFTEGLGKVDLAAGGSLEKALGSNYNYLGEGLVEKDGIYYTVKENGTIIEGKEGEVGGESTEVVTSYTQEDIDNSNGKLVAIGKTDPLYVVAAFNDDYSEVTITKNGANSDGLIMNWTSSTYKTVNPMYTNKSTLTSVEIEEGVTNTGEYAFYNCSGLTSVTIPNGVTTIGLAAFSSCAGLTSITIPDSVTSIDDYAFRECTGITSVTIPDGVTTIGYQVFRSCKGLTSVTIPDSVTSISDSTFEFCNITSVYITDIAAWCNIDFKGSGATPFCQTSGSVNMYLNGSVVTNLEIPNTITQIGKYTFYNCKEITSVTIPDSVTSIGEQAFDGCDALTSINIPNSVISIGEAAFRGCDALTSITIPDSITSISNETFYWCTGLTSVTIPDSVTSIGEQAFSICKALTSVTIPGSVTSIGKEAFSSCDELTSVTISDGVTTIGENAFYYNQKLTSITIPDSVTSIGEEAFYCSTALKNINFGGTTEQWNSITFGTDWNRLTGGYTIHCTNGDIAKS